jgi:hypothetical protein
MKSISLDLGLTIVNGACAQGEAENFLFGQRVANQGIWIFSCV